MAHCAVVLAQDEAEAFVIVSFENIQRKTQIMKNTGWPKWGKTFTWEINEVKKGCSTNLVVVVHFMFKTGNEQQVGSYTIPAWRMSKIVQTRTGNEGEEDLTLHQNGESVIGHNKQPSSVTLRIRVVEVPNTLETPADAQNLSKKMKILELIRSRQYDVEGRVILDLLEDFKVCFLSTKLCIVSMQSNRI